MKPACTTRVGFIFFAGLFEDVLQRDQADGIERSVKGVRRGGERPFQFALMIGKQGTVQSQPLWFVRDHLWRRFAHFKLGAHLLDLRGLLF
jgi:hypothetical protein